MAYLAAQLIGHFFRDHVFVLVLRRQVSAHCCKEFPLM